MELQRFAWRRANRSRAWCGKGAKLPLRRWPNLTDYIVQDGVIPRTALSRRAHRDREHGHWVRACAWPMCFHAGDGNLHPLVLYDRSIPGQEEAALDLSIASCACALTAAAPSPANTALGKEKQEALGYMFHRARPCNHATGALCFDPENISNPDKVFPRPRLCGDKPGPYVPHALETAGIAEIF